MMARIAKQHPQQLAAYAGAQVAQEILAFANRMEEPAPRALHADPFLSWVEQERLTLSPVVELIDPKLSQLDWLMLPGIMEREEAAHGAPPPVFAMFTVLKSDFMLARDLAWRAEDERMWPDTGRFADTLDMATYGPRHSALVLAQRTALDLLDKVAVTANHYFELGVPPNRVHFGRIWRDQRGSARRVRPLLPQVERAIHFGVRGLYGLVELADDYDGDDGIHRLKKELRNAGTHRFVVLHEVGDGSDARQAPEVQRVSFDAFRAEVLNALRVARSAIQTSPRRRAKGSS